MLTFSPLRALDSTAKPQSARLFRLKPFQNKIQLVEQDPHTETSPTTEGRSDTLGKIRLGAVRLYESVRYVARERLLGGEKARHAWFWLLLFFVLALVVMVVCLRMHSQMQTVQKRFDILVHLLQDARNIPGRMI